MSRNRTRDVKAHAPSINVEESAVALKKVALLVGIDKYADRSLTGCVNDARKIQHLLEKNQDGSPNFHCEMLLGPRETKERKLPAVQSALRLAIQRVLSRHVDMALIFFAGHGAITSRGGVLVTQDAAAGNEGVPMADLMTDAANSKIPEITIIVDACFSGQIGSAPLLKENISAIRTGVSILSASSPDEAAQEENSRGVFSSLVCGALDGGAADVVGEVNSASIYAYAEQALGPHDQRPMFKANVERLSPLRTCAPGVAHEILRKLPEYFENADSLHRLDPSYEPDTKQHPKGTIQDPRKVEIFKNLQKMTAARLVSPVDEEHMFYAAINSKACSLTPLGKHYWARARARLL